MKTATYHRKIDFNEPSTLRALNEGRMPTVNPEHALNKVSVLCLGKIQQIPPTKLNRIKKQEMFKQQHISKFTSLTKREIEIIQCLVQGYTSIEIGELLFISKFTVGQHRKNISNKLNINSYSDIFNYALAFDLI